MVSLDPKTHSIIASLYRAAAGLEPWADALQNTVGAFDFLGCQLVGINLERRAIVFSHTNRDAPVEADLEYIRAYHPVDPRIPLLLAAQPGEWIFCQDHFDEAYVASNPYYRELLMPYGGRYSASVNLHAEGQEAVLIAFMTRLGSGKISDEQREWLAAIGGHLQEAVRIYRRTRSLVEGSVMGGHLLDRISRPAFLVRPSREITFMNQRGSALVKTGSPLLQANDELTAFDSETDSLINEAISGMVAELDAMTLPARRIVRLPRKDSPHIAVSLTAFAPDASMRAFGDLTQILITVHSATPHSAPDLALWQAAFDLTPAQCRVAAEMYAGRGVKQAAKALQISEATARSHLKEIFAKTGTHRQGELVAALSALSS